jgi:hypothetical protein
MFPSAVNASGVLVRASGIGMSWMSRTLTLEHSARPSSIRSALRAAKGIESSVNTTTPATPFDLLMTYWALIIATSSTRVVTLVNSFGHSLGPGSAIACHPISVVAAATAWSTWALTDTGSNPPMTMPSGSSATA